MASKTRFLELYNKYLAENGGDKEAAMQSAFDEVNKQQAKRAAADQDRSDESINKRINEARSYLEQKEEQLEVERRIADLGGVKNADLKEQSMLLQEAKRIQQSILEEELHRENIDKDRIKAQIDLVVKLEDQIELNEQLNTSREHGNSITDAFLGKLNIANTGFGSMLGNAKNLNDKFRMMGNVVKGIGQQLNETITGENVISALGSMALQSLTALDKLNDQLFVTTGMQNMGAMAGEVASSLESISLMGPEVGSSISALQVEFKGFYDTSAATQKQLMRTNSILQQYGVAAQETAQMQGFLVTAMGETPSVAEATSREMVTLAQKLGIAPAEIMAGFNNASKSLAKFGPKMKKEFTNLQGAAVALNMDLGSLIGVMEGMDTFEGAATMAGGLNAVLGGAYLNSLELIGQTESERLITLKETLDMSGKQFDQMSKFERIGIAKQMGMGVDELAKFMRKDAKEIQKAMKEAEVKAKSQKQLEEERLKAMSIMSRLAIEIEKAFQEAFGGTDGMFNKENLAEIKTTISGFFGVIKSVAGVFKKIYGFWKSMFGDSDLAAVAATLATTLGGINLLKAAPGALLGGLGKLVFGSKGTTGGAGGGPDKPGLLKKMAGGVASRASGARAGAKEGEGIKGKLLGGLKGLVTGKGAEPEEVKLAGAAADGAMQVYIAGFSGEFAALYSEIIKALQSGGGPGGGDEEGGGLLDELDLGDGDGKKKRKQTGKQKKRARQKESKRGKRSRSRRAKSLLRKRAKRNKARAKARAKATLSKSASKGKMLGRVAGQKGAGKLAGKFAAKRIPGLGLAVGMADAASYLKSGQVVKGALEGASAIASSVPVVGTALSIALGAAVVNYDEISAGLKNIGKKAANLTEEVTGLNLTAGATATKPSKNPKYKQTRGMWNSLGTAGKESWCDDTGKPPYGTDPNSCSKVWIARRKRKDAERAKAGPGAGTYTTGIKIPNAKNIVKRSMPAPNQVNDARVKLNTSDGFEMTGVAAKPGGLLAGKLDKLIDLLSKPQTGGGSQPVVIQIDGRELGRATINQVNKLYSTSLE